jgi:multidrug efflux pump
VFARFFIDRPIFAAVLSIVITLAGGISVWTLPIAQYPQITPPTVQLDCNYPGANATTVAESIAAPIEQQVNGVEDMLYMSSACTNDGSYTLTVTFKLGVDLDVANVLVQNRANLALPQLPDVVKQTGVSIRKRSPDILLVGSVFSPDDSRSQLFLSNYAVINMRDEIARLPGISECFVFGVRDYSMRIWLDPERMSVRGLNAGDVVRALSEQNVQVAAGQLAQPPISESQMTQMVVTTTGRLSEPEEFADVVIKRGPQGQVVRIKDVGHVQLAARNEDISNRYDGKPAVGLAIFQLPDANALETADVVKAKIDELRKEFPSGVACEVGYDTTPFIRESIEEVVKALRDAIILVAIVVLVFLQSWRSAIIPLVAVPVAIIGTFAVMLAAGFSLNNLTLFGLVLAIGIVVDDAIVVVEAVEHHIERGLMPRDAAVKAMDEVSGPVIAVGLVLSAVFIPCAFISGIIGQFFRQFALTIAISTLISAFNSLTLSPALAAILLRPVNKGRRDWGTIALFFLLGAIAAPVLRAVYHVGAGWPALPFHLLFVPAGALAALGVYFGFNPAFGMLTRSHVFAVGKLFRVAVLVLLVYAGLLGLTYWGFQRLPSGFIPSQDKGYAIASIQLPDAASAGRTAEAIKKIEDVVRNTEGVAHTTSIAGNSFVLSAYGSNFGSMFIILKPFDVRRERQQELLRAAQQDPHPDDADLGNEDGLTDEQIEERRGKIEARRKQRLADADLTAEGILATLRKRLAEEVTEADVAVFGPPPVSGLGRAGGFRIMIEDRGDLGPRDLEKETVNLVNKMRQLRLGPPPGGDLDANGNFVRDKRPAAMQGAFTVYRADAPQMYVNVNRKECMQQGIDLGDVFQTLQTYLGSRYVNDFNRFGRTWQVVVQADAPYRNSPDDVKRLKVRNREGRMVPLGAIAEIKEITNPLVLTRYNTYPAASINGNAAVGVSTGDARVMIDQLAKRELPDDMKAEWTEIVFLEMMSGNTGMVIFGFSVVFVFLVLAAQYESWTLPLAVILVVPTCVLSSLVGVYLADHDVNVFTQVGFVVLIGLACKNAILIVEFAKLEREKGKSAREAALEACRLRLRPILMTSFAFILGVVPLVLAHGAGAEMRQVLGTAVFAGMLGVTLFGIFLTPVFFVVIDHVMHWRFFNTPAIVGINNLTLGLLRFRWVGEMIRGASK